MANDFKTPGVFVQEISKLPPSVAQVETAIPAFVGYTEKAVVNGASIIGESLAPQAIRIRSLADYEAVFGGPFPENGKLPKANPADPDTFYNNFNAAGGTITVAKTGTADAPIYTLDKSTGPVNPSGNLKYRMYYTMQLFFANGGGDCYVVSVGAYNPTPAISHEALIDALEAVKKEDEPTLIVFPDAVGIGDSSDFHSVYTAALSQCSELKDRFTICDIFEGNIDSTDATIGNDVIDTFRTAIGNNNLTYGAAYYPWLTTLLSPAFDAASFKIKVVDDGGADLPDELFLRVDVEDDELIRESDDAATKTEKETRNTERAAKRATSLFHLQNDVYSSIIDTIDGYNIVLPPSGIMAGVYARVDESRGVWKAPANVSINGVLAPTVVLDDNAQDDLNVHPTGKSVNAIRTFTGRGLLVWGARTLAGNDNEWRYVPVRRFFLMAEESIKKATEQFVFEPNDANTWTKVRGLIENFLLLQWRAGALQGAKPEQAFFVNVGLGETMNALDILEGRMNVEIGMAVVRPAEFIILKFSQILPQA